MGAQTQTALPVIDFSGLQLRQPGTEEWVRVRAQVMQALDAYGCFEVVDEKVGGVIRDAVFNGAMKEVLALPHKTKAQLASYLDGKVIKALESMSVDDCSPDGVRSLTRLMWPHGNDKFCETISNYSNQQMELDQIILRMIMESLGVERYFDRIMDKTIYRMRLSAYTPPVDQHETIAFGSHTDPNWVTMVCQHQIDGLEVQIRSGQWVRPKPLPNSFTVMLGDSMEAWSNGRLFPTPHRVMMSGTEKRYSTIFSSCPRDGHLVQTPEELVDGAHPLLFKPFEFGSYFLFRNSEAASKVKHALKAYCGVQGDEVQASA